MADGSFAMCSILRAGSRSRCTRAKISMIPMAMIGAIIVAAILVPAIVFGICGEAHVRPNQFDIIKSMPIRLIEDVAISNRAIEPRARCGGPHGFRPVGEAEVLVNTTAIPSSHNDPNRVVHLSVIEKKPAAIPPLDINSRTFLYFEQFGGFLGQRVWRIVDGFPVFPYQQMSFDVGYEDR